MACAALTPYFRRLPLRVLHVAFRFDVIRSKRVKQRGGIAAEAGIFKEQRVIKIIPDIGGEMNFRGNPHSDYAGPHRMSHWLSGDQVERERERRNDLRHPKRRTRAGTSARRGSRGQGGAGGHWKAHDLHIGSLQPSL